MRFYLRPEAIITDWPNMPRTVDSTRPDYAGWTFTPKAEGIWCQSPDGAVRVFTYSSIIWFEPDPIKNSNTNGTKVDGQKPAKR